ncbi:RES family NAD+ phosphorylase [Rhodococcus fascians]|uniref:RES family NAD+ phosphorylase n=1 Tax=Rhodococcoides fascians TaxID=1828 RepID=UPI0024B7A7EF|nr:RES family NAD+ phosphorylase [Rhodococcus fascians]MDJ0005512.1 RES family NAD+ phosphorylase [Rhodococcus fascians]
MSAERATNHLSEPNPPAQLAGFPTHTYPAGTAFVRSHSSGLGPWWFASNGAGRFDLAGTHGTCYVAEDEVITLLEKFGGMKAVPAYSIEGVSISSVSLLGDLVVADLTSNKGVAYGVTAEIFDTSDYPLTQRWAASLRAAGFAGVRYWTRHDLAHDHRAVAIFDAAGVPADPSGRSVRSTDALVDRTDLLERWQKETGVTVLVVPPL